MKKRPSSYNKLAEERTLLSNERTLLSYIRTTLTALIFGLAVLQLSQNKHNPIGYAAIIIGLLILIVGVIHFSMWKKKIKEEIEEDEN